MIGYLIYILFSTTIIVCVFCYLFKIVTCGWCKSKVCLIGKNIIVTGGNSGIGYEICLDLASRGCNVIIADKDNGEESVRKIKNLTNNPNITYKYIDLASFRSIRDFVKDIYQHIDKLDVLINNAGIGAGTDTKTEDGIDIVLQVNHYGPFLLTHLLLDLLKKASPSRIVCTSSPLVFPFTNFTLENLPKQCNTRQSYPFAKMAQLIIAKELAKRLKSEGIYVNAVNPGVVNTSIFKKARIHFMHYYTGEWEYFAFRFWVYILGKNCEQGAQTSIFAAIDKEIEEKNITGKFLWDCAPFFEPSTAKDENLCREIYEHSVEMVKLGPQEKLLLSN